MKKRSLIYISVALAAVIGLGSCITQEDDDKKKRPPLPLSWEALARAVDAQLLPVSDGSCSPTVGEHCKARFTGAVSQAAVAQLLRALADLQLFFGPVNTIYTDRAQVRNNLSIFFRHGFQPQTADACGENVNGNGTLDYLEFCAGGGTLACTDLGTGHYDLTYTGCAYVDGGGITWMLDGVIEYENYTTPYQESVAQADGDSLSLTDVTNNRRLVLSGQSAIYRKINPAIGGQAIGTTGHPDGMIILNLSVSLDLNNDAVIEQTYPITAANDFEDGLMFLNGKNAVWFSDLPNLADPGDDPIHFFMAGRPWNGHDALSCIVDIVGYDGVARTYGVHSQPLGVNDYYGTRGCVPSVEAPGLTY